MLKIEYLIVIWCYIMLLEYSATNTPPKQLIDTNVSSDYKKMASLFTLKNKNQNFEILKQIIEGIPQKTLITCRI